MRDIFLIITIDIILTCLATTNWLELYLMELVVTQVSMVKIHSKIDNIAYKLVICRIKDTWNLFKNRPGS